MKKLLFIDRDGTVIVEPKDTYQIDSFQRLEFIPGVITALARIAKTLEYEFVMVTNQDGLGTDSFPEETFWGPHNLMIKTLGNEGITFSDICIDRSFPGEMLSTRKPQTGMLQKYLYGSYDLKNSYVIGDRLSDIELAENLGAQSIVVGELLDTRASLSTNSWNDIAEYLIRKPRTATVKRKTKETDISISLSLDGNGEASIHTGIGFFDHMLTQVFYHGRLSGSIEVRGDLVIDEHHTIEDTALSLGQAVAKALGEKKGIYRYGFSLPMDEAMATVAIDFSGRPYFVWDTSFAREKIGEMPTEMFSHFFKSFCDEARCTLNIKATGSNEHHKIEAIFKAFGKALRFAVRKDPLGTDIPSTKGIL